jgi:hypothetical protein
MIHIDQILVTHDPQNPKDESYELTMDEVREYGETFFRSGFTADVFLSNDSTYSVAKVTDNAWEMCEYIDETDGSVSLGEIQTYEDTFEIALDQLLTNLNTREQYLANN